MLQFSFTAACNFDLRKCYPIERVNYTRKQRLPELLVIPLFLDILLFFGVNVTSLFTSSIFFVFRLFFDTSLFFEVPAFFVVLLFFEVALFFAALPFFAALLFFGGLPRFAGNLLLVDSTLLKTASTAVLTLSLLLVYSVRDNSLPL